jgi:uncharacterized membrane protein YhaH (DUF805 family)
MNTVTQGVLLSERSAYEMSLWVFGLGALIVALIIVFALALLFSARWHATRGLQHFEKYLDHLLMHMSGRREMTYFAAAMTSAYAEYLSRRNEFWVTYGQTTVSVLLLIVVTVLLLTKTINPDAGLPILSGIAGFAIAKTTGTPRGLSAPPPEGREGQ